MKQLLSFLAIMIFAAANFTGCAQDPNSSDNSLMPMKSSPPPAANAHPAFTFRYNVTSKSKTYATVGVSDSDGTDLANVYTSASANTVLTIVSPTWSANGSSVSFVEKAISGSSSPLIKAVDVSVVSGVAKGSNARTIYTGSDNIVAQAWCPNASTAKIAFITKNSSNVFKIYTVSTSGGTATNIYTSSGSDIIGGTITWSNNGSELAFAYKSGSTVSIKVINASTGAENADLVSGNYLNISSVKWSHSGSNTLAFSATTVAGNAVSDYYLYTIAPTSGSTETQCVNGFNGEWSPNNATLVYTDGFNNTKKVTISSGTVTTIGSYVPYGDWK